MKWVTRERPRVDRVACAWLIRRFIDAEPEFLFVPNDQVEAVAEREDAISSMSAAASWPTPDETGFEALIRFYNVDRTTRRCGVWRRSSTARTCSGRKRRPNPPDSGDHAGAGSTCMPMITRSSGAGVPVYESLYRWCRRQASAR